MKLVRHQAGLLDANSYIVTDEEAKQLMVIDPAQDLKSSLERFHADGFELLYVLFTHGHFDHIAGGWLCKKMWPKAQILVHTEDSGLLSDPRANLSEVFLGTVITSPEPDRLLSDGDELLFGGVNWQVLHTPGHSEGSLCLMGNGWLFTGDTLFCGGVGRTDMPGGSDIKLRQSLNKLSQLPGHLIVYPGHGPDCLLRDVFPLAPGGATA